MDEPILSGFIYCHGKDDYSQWDVEISQKDQEAIEKILKKYETEGSSVRNIYDSNNREYTFNLNDMLKTYNKLAEYNGKRWISSTEALRYISLLTGETYDDLYKKAKEISR